MEILLEKNGGQAGVALPLIQATQRFFAESRQEGFDKVKSL
ncbi:hypothetical protein WCP94_001647 [Bilophila wadsworthia]